MKNFNEFLTEATVSQKAFIIKYDTRPDILYWSDTKGDWIRNWAFATIWYDRIEPQSTMNRIKRIHEFGRISLAEIRISKQLVD